MTGWANGLTNRTTSNSFEMIKYALPQAKWVNGGSTGRSEGTITGQSESSNSERQQVTNSEEQPIVRIVSVFFVFLPLIRNKKYIIAFELSSRIEILIAKHPERNQERAATNIPNRMSEWRIGNRREKRVDKGTYTSRCSRKIERHHTIESTKNKKKDCSLKKFTLTVFCNPWINLLIYPHSVICSPLLINCSLPSDTNTTSLLQATRHTVSL